MRKAAKYLVLIAGLLGGAAFFLPFLVVSYQGREVPVSAFDAVRGMDAVGPAIESAAGERTARASAAADAEAQRVRTELGATLDKVRAFLYAVYAPSLVLVLLGLLGAVNRRFGRGFGALALLLGGAIGAVWYLITAAEVDEHVAFGLGVELLLASAAAAALGGGIALFIPDIERAGP